jgi:hypothetical protein
MHMFTCPTRITAIGTSLTESESRGVSS